MTIIQERSIALAAILQASALVQSLARSGECDADQEQCLQKSVVVMDAVNTPSVYGGLAELRGGLGILAGGILSTPNREHLESLRYSTDILKLQSELYRDQNRFKVFADEIHKLAEFNESEFVVACSDLYQQYVSPLSPRIIVQGEEQFLQTDGIPDRIRCLLLAGIRSAVLWNQKGGSRFKLIWERTRMQNAASSLLQRA